MAKKSDFDVHALLEHPGDALASLLQVESLLTAYDAWLNGEDHETTANALGVDNPLRKLLGKRLAGAVYLAEALSIAQSLGDDSIIRDIMRLLDIERLRSGDTWEATETQREKLRCSIQHWTEGFGLAGASLPRLARVAINTALRSVRESHWD